MTSPTATVPDSYATSSHVSSAMAPPPAEPWLRVFRSLRERAIESVFGLPDDDMQALAAARTTGTRLLWTPSQRAGVFMAAGTGLRTGRAGVCVVGRGPAVAACVPGVVEARSAGAPVVILGTGTPAADRGIRAFQDLDIRAVMGGVAKQVLRADPLPRVEAVLAEAFEIAEEAPTGPVFVEVPALASRVAAPTAPPRPIDLSGTLELVERAAAPVLVLGGGVRHGDVGHLALAAAERLGALLLVTASGRSSVPEDYCLFGGLAGFYLHPAVRAVLDDADLVVTLGSRWEETAREGIPESATVLQVNVRAAEVNHTTPGHYCATSAEPVLDGLAHGPSHGSTPWREQVLAAVASARETSSSRREHSTIASALGALADHLQPPATVYHENGLADMWSYDAAAFPLPTGCRSVAPSEQTTLGFGVAAAVGWAASSGEHTVGICGDTALETMLPDLGFPVRHGGRLLLVVMANGGMGWLAHQADASGIECDFLTSAPSWRAAARAVGWSVLEVGAADAAPSLVRRALDLSSSGHPTLLAVDADPHDHPPFLGQEVS